MADQVNELLSKLKKDRDFRRKKAFKKAFSDYVLTNWPAKSPAEIAFYVNLIRYPKYKEPTEVSKGSRKTIANHVFNWDKKEKDDKSQHGISVPMLKAIMLATHFMRLEKLQSNSAQITSESIKNELVGSDSEAIINNEARYFVTKFLVRELTNSSAGLSHSNGPLATPKTIAGIVDPIATSELKNPYTDHVVDECKDVMSDTDKGGPTMVGPDKKQLLTPRRYLKLSSTTGFKELVGRTEELEMLTAAWDDTDTHILIFFAEAGVGKTSLVEDWLTDFRKDRCNEIVAYFPWSFFSQGTRGSANSDLFFTEALEHFGAHPPAVAAAVVKADLLAKCVASKRTLLVLDGIEPLQHPPQPGLKESRLNDEGLEQLLMQLAQPRTANGLCIVTTRVSVLDLERYCRTEKRPRRPVQEVELRNLSDTAAAQLLHQAGACRAGEVEIAPDDDALKIVAGELNGHALTAQLLGSYLKHAHSGNIIRRDYIKDWSKIINKQKEGHAKIVMESYVHWFEQNEEDGRRQLAILRLLGLFDRPASVDSLGALCDDKVIADLTEPLVGLDRDDFNEILTHLAEEHRLVSLQHDDGGQVMQVDTHALYREYFAMKLRQDHPTAWTEGHRRLYTYLCNTPEQDQPDTLDDLEPLYQAVVHGCNAGLHQQCLEVYRKRILRGTGKGGYYSLKKHGAYGGNLSAAKSFFIRQWSEVSSNLLADEQAWIMFFVGVNLGNQGRLNDAEEPMLKSVEMAENQRDLSNASYYAGHLSELELTLGKVDKALEYAEKSVEFDKRSKKSDLVARMKQLSKYADALHQAGQPDKAQRLFEEAETPQDKEQDNFLKSVRGFQYCDLLLSGAERAAWQRVVKPESSIPNRKELQDACDRVTKRAKWTPKRARDEKDDPSILSVALDHLTIGRAALYRALLTTETEADDAVSQSDDKVLTEAVDGFHESGAFHYLPRGLLTRAWQRQLSHDTPGATTDLDEAWKIAKRGPMPLYQAEILLSRARLFGTRLDTDSYPWDSPQTDLAEARRLIEKHGYYRRNEELENAEAALRDAMSKQRRQ